jgi:hypothetical protein
MDAILARLESMEQEEARLLITRQQGLAMRARTSTGFLWGLGGLNFLFVVSMLIALHRLAKVKSLVTICAWSRTVEYHGEWLSFEQYMPRRFNINTSHSISPEEQEKAFGNLK